MSTTPIALSRYAVLVTLNLYAAICSIGAKDGGGDMQPDYACGGSGKRDEICIYTCIYKPYSPSPVESR